MAHALLRQRVLAAYGMSRDDIMSRGGRVIYTAGMPNRPDRLGAVARGEPDAVLDEALPVFAREAIDMGMQFLAVDGPQLKMLEADGLMRAAITDEEYPSVGETIWMVDFSGWPLFCLAGAPDEMIYNFCAGLEARKDHIPWYGEGPLPLNKLCKDSVEGPLYLPLRAVLAGMRISALTHSRVPMAYAD